MAMVALLSKFLTAIGTVTSLFSVCPASQHIFIIQTTLTVNQERVNNFSRFGFVGISMTGKSYSRDPPTNNALLL